MSGLTLGAAVGLLRMRPDPVGAEPPPETTRLRISHGPVCQAPQFAAEGLLRDEGFSRLDYIKQEGVGLYRALAAGEVDLSTTFVAPFIIQVDAADPVVLLAGVHVGCLELFGTDRVRGIADLKGKVVAISARGGPSHVFLVSMLAHVGVDHRSVNWVTYPRDEAIRRLAAGEIDALMAFPPDPQELRTRKIGRVVVNTAKDRPWAQYFCCMLAGNAEFVRKNPVATKRAVRAIIKGIDICALEPERTARLLVDRGFTPRYDYAVGTLKSLPYRQWREYDPEDTVRFYALRLHEAGMIKSTPQRILTQGTDWRFLNELKRELKG